MSLFAALMFLDASMAKDDVTLQNLTPYQFYLNDLSADSTWVLKPNEFHSFPFDGQETFHTITVETYAEPSEGTGKTTILYNLDLHVLSTVTLIYRGDKDIDVGPRIKPLGGV